MTNEKKGERFGSIETFRLALQDSIEWATDRARHRGVSDEQLARELDTEFGRMIDRIDLLHR